MIKTTLNWTVKNLKHMYDAKETLSFDHPIQRQSAQWSNLQQSLLIHSILANFPVPAIYVQKSDAEEADDKGKTLYKYSVLDGKQRMTTIFSFINGEYALNEETPDAEKDLGEPNLSGTIKEVDGTQFTVVEDKTEKTEDGDIMIAPAAGGDDADFAKVLMVCDKDTIFYTRTIYDGGERYED